MHEIFSALNLERSFELVGEQCYPSCFSVSDLAAHSIGAVGDSLAHLLVDLGLSNTLPRVQVDQRLASLWFAQSIHPIGWNMPPVWDSIAGDYQTKDGWIKLHTNLAHHRAAALSVLQVKTERDEVSKAVRSWDGQELESKIVAAGGVAATLRSRFEWIAHPQGKALASEPLIDWGEARQVNIRSWPATQNQPLKGLRILDLTRVLAGPVATRTLAGFGAQVLRIDPPGWDEGVVVPDITLGKQCAYLDLKQNEDRKVFEALLANADVLVHGYRPDALENLGLGEAFRLDLAPKLIEVKLDAYGWTGPWAKRRGFDSLVQMSCGIAEAGMGWTDNTQPTPLPVQALDHATGYLMAAALIRALSESIKGGGLKNTRLSLARTADILINHPQVKTGTLGTGPTQNDFCCEIEQTPWGQAHRLKPALVIGGSPMQWSSPACNFGSALAEWA
jgi:hypothetical protein